jgi:hypothetical protein
VSCEHPAFNNGKYRGWQEHIAEVPQAIFIVVSADEENIFFDVPKDQIKQKKSSSSRATSKIVD